MGGSLKGEIVIAVGIPSNTFTLSIVFVAFTMTLSTWLLYVTAILVLTATLGPSVLMCVSTSVDLGGA